MEQAAPLRWAQLNHEQASWCFNEGAFTTAKNSLYPPVLQTPGLVSVYLRIFIFPVILQVSDLAKLQSITAENCSLLIVLLVSVPTDWCV